MGLDVRPSLVHARADQVAEAGQMVAVLGDDLTPLRSWNGSFETDALLARLADRLEVGWADLAQDAKQLAEAMHESAASVEHSEATNTELAERFFREPGGP